MRASLQALAVSGALIVTVGVAPAMGQSAPPADAASPAAAAAAPAPTPVSNADIKEAISQIRRALRSYTPCNSPQRCSGSFDSFGVALTFNDGTLVAFSHEQRLKQSGHDCILMAREALQRGDRALAVQWVMAAHMDDPLTRNWLGDHPDAVVEGLRRFGG